MSRSRTYLAAFASFLLVPCGIRAQYAEGYVLIDSASTATYNRHIYISPSDTLIYVTWATTTVEAVATNRKAKAKYDRLEQRVVKVYPYARAAADVMAQCEAHFETVKDERSRKELLDLAEEEMKRQFEKDLRKMTINEGILLIKLIDRETGETSFELIQELKGRFSAFMWQSVARLFGHNLKTDYDAEGDDRMVENIVSRIESGDLPVVLFHVDPFLQSHFVNR